MDALCEEAYAKAAEVLRRCSHTLGMKASGLADGYPQVWARDSMITLLGASFLPDKKIGTALRASLGTLRKHQSRLGGIPNNVDVRTQKPNFQAYADGGLWFIIGNAVLFAQTGNEQLLRQNYPAMQKVLQWYEYQNPDQSGLITMSEGADWEDLLATRGKSLYVNMLYYTALQHAGNAARTLGDNALARSCAQKAKKLHALLNYYFWCRGYNELPHIRFSFGTDINNSLRKSGRRDNIPHRSILHSHSYYLPYLTFHGFGEWFDTFGNLLAILSGVANTKQAEGLITFINAFDIAKPYPIRTLYPPILPGEKDWRDYYRHGNLNLPDQYHNGGIWPFLGGFYVAALVKLRKHAEATEALALLAQLNRKGKKGPWEFNEWFHGKTAEPMGKAQQAWSAGMYAYAFEVVRGKKTLFF